MSKEKRIVQLFQDRNSFIGYLKKRSELSKSKNLSRRICTTKTLLRPREEKESLFFRNRTFFFRSFRLRTLAARFTDRKILFFFISVRSLKMASCFTSHESSRSIKTVALFFLIFFGPAECQNQTFPKYFHFFFSISFFLFSRKERERRNTRGKEGTNEIIGRPNRQLDRFAEMNNRQVSLFFRLSRGYFLGSRDLITRAFCYMTYRRQ